METWKISNTSNQEIKFACKLSSMASRGIILKPNEFCITEGQSTATMQAQERRRFLVIDKEYDNSTLQLELVKAYTETQLEQMILENESNNKSDFEKAAENAEKYINNETNNAKN